MPRYRMNAAATKYMKGLLKSFITRRDKNHPDRTFGISEILNDFEKEERDNLFDVVDYHRICNLVTILVTEGFLEKMDKGRYIKTDLVGDAHVKKLDKRKAVNV